MGQELSTGSDAPSMEEFKDQVFGAVVFLLSPEYDQELEFVDEDEENEGRHVLPRLKERDFVNYYQKNQEQINEYIQNYVLDSAKNASKYHDILVKALLDSRAQRQHQDRSRIEENASDADTYAETSKQDVPKEYQP